MKTEENYLSASLAVLSEIVGDNLPDKVTMELRCPRSGHTSNVAIREKKKITKAMALRWVLLGWLRT